MAFNILTPTGNLASAWARTADASKFRARPDTKSAVRELAPGAGSFGDDFSTNPMFGRMYTYVAYNYVAGTEFFDWQTPNYRLRCRPGNNSNVSGGFFIYHIFGRIADLCMKARMTLSSATLDRMRPGLVGRFNAASKTYYLLYMHGGKLYLYRCVNGASTQISVSGTLYSGSGDYQLKFQLSGTTLRGKVWQDGTGEPDWQLTASDGNIAAPGEFGIQLAGAYIVESYADDFQADVALAADSPVLYTR